MGALQTPKPAKYFAGLLAGDVGHFTPAQELLQAHVGEIEFESEAWPFGHTRYYEAELGPNVWRRFVVFRRVRGVEELPLIKRATNDLEHVLCDQMDRPRDRRPVNIDPGYLTLSKLVLASTKDYSHRLYLSDGIYAETTLRFEGGAWRPWPWTYPDYAEPTYHAVFTLARTRLKAQWNEAPR